MPGAVAFTGHRPQHLGGFEDNPTHSYVKHQLGRLIGNAISMGYDTFIAGGALGVDQWAADIILKKRSELQGVKLIIAVPCEGQDKKWSKEARDHYQWQLSQADDVILVTKGPYAAWKMQARNQWMVDRADLVIAVYDGTPSGTGNCVQYALKQGVTVWAIDPRLPGMGAYALRPTAAKRIH